MVRNIIQIGNEKLRKASEEVSRDFSKSKEFVSIKQDLLDTLRAQNLGVAISSIQMSEPYKVFLIEIRERPNRSAMKPFGPKYFVNPEIVKLSEDKILMMEGCLSVFNSSLFGEVYRPSKITLKYYDEDFTEIVEDFDGLLSRSIQHEIDHLNGILFTDIVEVKSITTLDEYRKKLSREKGI